MDQFQDRRLEFDAILRELLGSSNVYFQPPEDFKMQYPCIVYELDNASLKSADNMPYHWTPRYQVSYLDYDPDGEVKRKLALLPLSSFSRHYATSGLNHDVYVIYH